MTKKILLAVVLLISSLTFGACVAKPASLTTEDPNTNLTGVVTQTGSQFSIKTDTGIVTLESRKVDLSSAIGKTVTVIGQYSGTTLFVDKIE